MRANGVCTPHATSRRLRAINAQPAPPTTDALEAAPAAVARGARSQRTREGVVDALLRLVRQGNFRPTAREISDEAGTSLRSVYVHFDDLEDLFCAAAERQGQSVAHLMTEIDISGDFPSRLDAYVQQHVEVWEAIAPVWFAAKLQEAFSPSLAAILASTRQRSNRYLRHVFATEIAALPASQMESIVTICETIASTATWDQWRRLEQKSAQECTQTVSVAFTQLLAPGGSS